VSPRSVFRRGARRQPRGLRRRFESAGDGRVVV